MPEPTATQLSNIDFRAGAIRDICRDLDDMDTAIDDLNEKRRDYRKQKIKNELGIKLGDFDAMRRIYKMDEGRKNDYLDALREGFKALGVEEQLDWIEADKRIEAKIEAQIEDEDAESDAVDAGPVNAQSDAPAEETTAEPQDETPAEDEAGSTPVAAE